MKAIPNGCARGTFVTFVKNSNGGRHLDLEDLVPRESHTFTKKARKSAILGVTFCNLSSRASYLTTRTGTGMLQISAPPTGTMKNASRRFARASA